MTEPDTQTLTERRYQIGGVAYRLEALSWQQHRWLADHIFTQADVATINYGFIHDCGRVQGPLFMAICLLAEGQTRQQKSKQAWAEIEALADEFRGWLDGPEVAIFCTHFFFSCRPDQMTMLVPGRVLQELFEREAEKAAVAPAPPPIVPSPAPGGSTSSAALSPSATATSPASSASLSSGAPASPPPISSGALSDGSLITAS